MAFVDLMIHICYSWSLAPRRQGVTDEQPRIVVCHGKFVKARSHLRNERDQASASRVVVERDQARVYHGVVTHCLLSGE